MELKEEMYVRTKNGYIGKITELYCQDSYEHNVRMKIDGSYSDYLLKEIDFEKASHNIIDLIEVGDYVNGLKVIEVRKHLHGDIEIKLSNGEFEWSFSKNESDYKIKTIVTKEQFESMQYVID